MSDETRVGQGWIHDVQRGHVMIIDAEMFASSLELMQEDSYERGREAERRKWKVIRATNWVLWAAVLGILVLEAVRGL